MQEIQRQLNERMLTATDAFRAQNEMHMIAEMMGHACKGGWYAVLTNGAEKYEYHNVLWVSGGKDKMDYTILGLISLLRLTLRRGADIFLLQSVQKSSVFWAMPRAFICST